MTFEIPGDRQTPTNVVDDFNEEPAVRGTERVYEAYAPLSIVL